VLSSYSSDAPATVILILSDYYLPGFKAGGPIRTLANMGERLGSDLTIRLVTRDRDLGDNSPYPGISTTGWENLGKVQVAYRRADFLGPLGLRRLIVESTYDVLYLNSLFSRPFTIQALLLRRLGVIPRVRTVLAPRGELARAALARKWLKKRIFLAFARMVGLYRDLIWQASCREEADEIRREFGGDVTVVIAPDLPADDENFEAPPRMRVKTPGTLRLVYLSRIVRKKNLVGALEALRGMKGSVELDIFGPQEQPEYWRECSNVIRTLPANVAVRAHGAIPSEAVPAVLANYDVFIFPTRGENFGHVVLEALLAGVPVLVSDQTPWRGLEEREAGWDLPLDQPSAWVEVLERCLTWDEETWSGWSRGALRAGREYAQDTDILATNLDLLRPSVASANRVNGHT
jgi:glycosyltransferase involved in cell wall biosynthesis